MVVGEVVIDLAIHTDGTPCVVGHIGNEADVQRCFRIDPSSTRLWLRNTQRLTEDVVFQTSSAEEFRFSNMRVLSSSLTDENGSLGLGFGSDVETHVRTSIMLTHNQMILDPQSPESLCHNNQLAAMLPVRRTQTGRNMESYDVEISLVSQNDGTPFLSRGIRTGASSGELTVSFEKTVIPASMYSAINLAYQTLTGFPLSSESTQCTSILNQLPAIKFSISQRQISQAVDVVLFPEDYMHIDPVTGYCSPLLGETRSQHSYELGYNTLQNMNILLDYANNRIGFCDPI